MDAKGSKYGASNRLIAWRPAEYRVEHRFRVLKRQFGYAKVRYKGLAKNGAPMTTLFALVNLWMARKTLLQVT